VSNSLRRPYRCTNNKIYRHSEKVSPFEMKNFIQFIFFAFLVGCGPLYQTDYVFTPPKSSGGVSCTYQCETVKSQCEQIEELEAERCESYSQSEQDSCEADIRYRKNREPKWYECVPDSCSVDKEKCETNYRTCYQSCGGRVETVTRCVANCDKIPQPQKK